MKPRALFVIPNSSTFTQVDRRILSELYELETLDLGQSQSRWHYLGQTLKMGLKSLFGNARLVVVWFADYHAAVAVLAARLRAKKSVIFIGGYDAVSYDELGMGVYQSPLRAACARFALKACNLIVSNHEALLDSSNTYYNPDGHAEGVYQMLPGLKTHSAVVYNAITTAAPLDVELQEPRQQRFLCVGTTPRFEDIINKGFDLIAQAAALRPDWHFEIVGISQEWLPEFKNRYNTEALENLNIYSYLPHQQVLRMMRKSRYFIQASISEGMPNALMEAMLMGCIGIGSKVSGIPTIISDQGVIFHLRDAQSLIAALDSAMSLDLDPIEISRRISAQFSLQNRQQGIKQALESLLYSQTAG